MNDPSIRSSFHKFRTVRRDLIDGAKSTELEAALSFAVGILMGGGFPGSAAAVSILADRAFPDAIFMWSEDVTEADATLDAS
jgi:hypothetical protein